MIVVDASAAMSALLNAGPARRALADDRLAAPYLIDSEVAGGLRRLVAEGRLDADAGWSALSTLPRLGMTRYPAMAMLDRIWELRPNLSSYDATYVALAEELECPLVTADRRLGRAPGVRCPITLVPR